MSEKSTGATKSVKLTLSAVKGLFGFLGRAIVTFIMVGIITGCIVAAVMTVYILKYVGADSQIDLEAYELGYTSIIYATDYETGKTYELQRLYRSNSNRIWIDYDDIAPTTVEALIAIEDKRFMEHSGVDWKRTFGAFVDMFLPGSAKGGGSTITQQLIKNLTDDDDVRIDRKVREIFRALDLSQRYSREQILEAYLNVVSFGAGTNGIEAASNIYFGKSAGELNLAESAAIVGITQKPTAYNPLLYPDNNKDRQLWVLREMFEQGRITEAEYEKAKTEKLNFKTKTVEQVEEQVQSYFVDHVINEVIRDLMDEKGMTKTKATTDLYEGGYKIYITMDAKIQSHLEDIYLNDEKFPAVHNEIYPQSAAIVMDPNGKLLGIVGGIGKKDKARIFNRATMATRQPGSSIKPLGAYALSFEYDRIRWSTIVDDNAINIAQAGQPDKWWPVNYYGKYVGSMTVDTAVQRSTNTIPVRLIKDGLGEKTVFDFLHDKLQMTSLVERRVENGRILSDIEISPMALGSLTDGVTPMEMVGGYQMFVNGGTFTKPYAYTEVRDANDRIVLRSDTTARRVIAEDTATVMNKLLQRVTNGPMGTGTSARLANMPTGGKTGTSDEDVNQWFIGFTPYYVCGVWLGYDEEKVVKINTSTGTKYTAANTIYYNGLGYPPPKLWKTIMEPLSEGQEYMQFFESPDVVSRQYCTISGDLAGAQCTSVGTGWYKKSNQPNVCFGHIEQKSADPDGDGDSGSTGGSDDDGGVSRIRRSDDTPTDPLIVR